MFKKTWINAYFTEYQDRWDAKTIRARKSMFNKLYNNVGCCDAEEFFSYLEENLKPYSRVTYVSAVKDYYQWLLETGKRSGENVIAKLRVKKAQKFKHAYKRKITGLRYEEVAARIQQIEQPEVRSACEAILQSGLRISELYSVDNGVVTGKFGKQRPYLGKVKVDTNLHPNTIRYHLKKVGLKPHDLRKAFATKLIDSNIQLADVASAVGWSSYRTAALYFQPKQDDALRNMVQAAIS